jgi:hypothetical protein
MTPATDRNAGRIHPINRRRKEQMSGSTSIDHDSREARRYEIRIKGHLDDRWAAWFDGLSLSLESDGTTTIRGSVVDQAALHGLLQRVRDTGLQLVSLTPTEPDQPQIPAAEPWQDRQITKEITR